MSPPRSRRWHGTAALGVTAAVLLAACSDDAPGTEAAETPGPSAPAEGDAAGAGSAEGDGGSEGTQEDSEQPAIRLYDASAGSVEESLPLAAQDLEGAGLDPTFYRLDWPGADEAALLTYDDPEAVPPALHRTYPLLVETSQGSFWAVAHDEVERFEESPVTDVLASFRPQE